MLPKWKKDHITFPTFANRFSAAVMKSISPKETIADIIPCLVGSVFLCYVTKHLKLIPHEYSQQQQQDIVYSDFFCSRQRESMGIVNNSV